MNAENLDPHRTSGTLLARVKDLDDADGWREFFLKYRQLVLGIARRHGLQESEAEEVAQEVFTRVARNIGLFESGGRTGSFRKWLGQLTQWCALDVRRKRPPFGAFRPGASGEEHQQELEQVPASSSTGPEEEVGDQDFKELLLRRLRQLVSERDYRIYEMISFKGCTPQEVAERMGVSRVAVDTILCRVRKAARAELDRLGERIV
ncbi:MAG: sigma-70 family RNA polymerase sigma factor [Verrucomicrobiales bacterium]|nr:sigma-70 family RNA polymerase sigma factor [Verrucomicrobiales bacterium]